MKKLMSVTLTGFCLLLMASIAHTSDLFSEDAVATARHFAQIIDNGNYADAYSQASPILRLAQTQQEFVTSVERERQLLGPVQQRHLKALRAIGIYPRFPDGDYLIVQFEARTMHKEKAAEVILLRHQNGVWLVADYSIR